MIKGERIKVKDQADQFDTIKTMRQVCKMSSKHPYFQNFVNRYNLTENDLPKLYKVLYNFLDFERDSKDAQVIKTASRTLTDRQGNCVDFSVLTGAFLINMGIPFSFRMVSFDGSENFSHIYTVLEDGTPFDLVIGKEFDEMPGIYGVEMPNSGKLDLKIN